MQNTAVFSGLHAISFTNTQLHAWQLRTKWEGQY